jgi:pimeloyl-ACP methyl ester carboxylesterase
VFRELSCQFGELERLNGIVTFPSSGTQPVTALILVTAGFTSKSGPFRLYTFIARQAAENGLVALRFDLGGIGNSEQIDPGSPLHIRTESDIQQAVNYLTQQFGIENFVLGGLCSGAEDAFRFAKNHENVRGVILLDGYAYRTFWYRVRHLISRRFLNRLIRWTLSKIGLLKLVHQPREADVDGDRSGLVDYKQMPMEESVAILEILISRQTKLLYIYTGGMIEKYNHKKQFYQMFPDIDFQDLVTLSYLPEMGHVQVFEEDRTKLCGVISEWLQQDFSRKITHRPEG